MPTIIAATEGSLDNQQGNEYQVWQINEQTKRDNDIKYIQSLENFTKGLQLFYNAYGNKVIPEEDVYIDFEDRSIRKQFDSHILYRFLVSWDLKDKKASLSRAMKIIKVRENFEYFQASEIANFDFRGTPNEAILKEIARNYFEVGLATLDFRNCIVEKNNRITRLGKQALIGEIFEKFEFDGPSIKLMELVWLDQGGTRNFETAELNKGKSLTQKLLAKIEDDELWIFKQKIHENLKLGILSSGVMGNHIGLCRHLKIFESKDTLRDIFISNAGDDLSKIDLLNIYLELGGDLSAVVDYFKGLNDYNVYFYFHFVSKLIESYPDIVEAALLNCLSADSASKQSRVEAAQFLCSLGNIAGFRFLKKTLWEERKPRILFNHFRKYRL